MHACRRDVVELRHLPSIHTPPEKIRTTLAVFPEAPAASSIYRPSMPSLLDDPWVAQKIDTVVAKYRHLWTEDQVRAFREAMAWTLATHPVASKRLERERAGAAEKSGTRAKDRAAPESDVEQSPSRKGAAR